MRYLAQKLELQYLYSKNIFKESVNENSPKVLAVLCLTSCFILKTQESAETVTWLLAQDDPAGPRMTHDATINQIESV